MSSPPSQQSNPPEFADRDQVILAGRANAANKHMSDEEAQLLNSGSEDEDNDEVQFIELKNQTVWYKSTVFIWFVLASSILPLIIIITAFAMEAKDTPFSLAFVMAIVTTIYGGCSFVPRILLKEELSKTYDKNQKHRFHADKIRGQIKAFESAKSELRATKEDLINANQETKKLLGNLQMLNVGSMEEMDESAKRAAKLAQEWAAMLVEKERTLLHILFDRCEYMDSSHVGVNKQEFDMFVQSLPDGYAERMNRLGSFEKLSNGNGYIDYQSFKAALDVFAEMEVNDHDIEFEIEKKETGVDDAGNKQYETAVIKKSTKMRRKIMNKLMFHKEP
mmetsp:Transcript_9557/g.15371  ORF Transcript_9557/g.15371 Transcript_9557/m.15371 type:complete len:335 (-) Transcript_9557:304-1308(-)|eukprot:CAMPEP_0197034336 /NCGR_PEP_ID=MMETSP1384-20130603/12482_1 /TAXON_ID=29189 /ORGANISM="Ammonia sp." /LENGTH=334 /DNA_ID=CAMNT_0042464255 /DNA_START=23 /DNA_END=1027 /DNA_ORIENTATION=+